MFWNVTFIYNAFIRTIDHCKVQTAFVSLFYIFINMKPWNASNSSVVVVGLLLIMLNGTLNANLLILLCFTRAFNEFLRIFLISENSLKFANFFAEVTNSQSMIGTKIGDLEWPWMTLHGVMALFHWICWTCVAENDLWRNLCKSLLYF